METSKPSADESDPKSSRPKMPAAYGVPRDGEGMLPWSHVTERMERATCYWVCTLSHDNRPHATPVDGLWLDGKLYFGGSPETRRSRNLRENPAVCIHLESGHEVVILHGDAHELRSPERALAERLSEASKKKYGYGPKPEEYEIVEGIFVFQPRMVLAWKEFPKDATRWRLEDED
jgi:nitroimidazol reductase NimA-like FMN-containing flavoprotein (pyridoxamine 5'-phosphate oxidase superfamily)